MMQYVHVDEHGRIAFISCQKTKAKLKGFPNLNIVEYALSRNMSSTMISEYGTKLISKEVLQKNLKNYTKLRMMIKTLNSIESFATE